MRLILVLVLLISAAGLGLIAWQAVQPPAPRPVAAAEAAPPPPARIRLLVAARALPAGSLLKEEDVAVREVSPQETPGNALPDTPEQRAELRGAMLRVYHDAGTFLASADVLRPRDRGFLSAVLRPGTRAISVGVDAVTGTAGLIWPGDQVDLILTQEFTPAQAAPDRRVVAETVLTDIRVIAVDQRLTQGAGGEAPSHEVARTLTLEVTGKEAERVAVAGRLGRLSVTVRAMQDGEATEPAGRSAVFGADVSSALAQPGPETSLRMKVVQGNETQDVTFR